MDNNRGITPGCGFFMSQHSIYYIEQKANVDGSGYNWKTIVKEALLSIYGKNIEDYSSLRTSKGAHPGIDGRLYKGLHDRPASKGTQSQELNSAESVIEYTQRHSMNTGPFSVASNYRHDSPQSETGAFYGVPGEGYEPAGSLDIMNWSNTYRNL